MSSTAHRSIRIRAYGACDFRKPSIFPGSWQRAIRILSDLRWTSHPFLTLDDWGCPELQLVISADERRAALRAVSHVRSETGIAFFFCNVVCDWLAESRGISLPDEVTHRDGGGV